MKLSLSQQVPPEYTDGEIVQIYGHTVTLFDSYTPVVKSPFVNAPWFIDDGSKYYVIGHKKYLHELLVALAAGAEPGDLVVLVTGFMEWRDATHKDILIFRNGYPKKFEFQCPFTEETHKNPFGYFPKKFPDRSMIIPDLGNKECAPCKSSTPSEPQSKQQNQETESQPSLEPSSQERENSSQSSDQPVQEPTGSEFTIGTGLPDQSQHP